MNITELAMSSKKDVTCAPAAWRRTMTDIPNSKETKMVEMERVSM